MRVIEVQEPLLRVKDTLGEAPVWDAIRQTLFWVDIDGKRVHSYIPAEAKHACRIFPHKISAIACTDKNDGLIAAIDNGFAFIPFESLDDSNDAVSELEILHTVSLQPGEKRFNEGMVDPAGRFLAGTMGLEHGTHDGRMFALCRGDMKQEPVKVGITCTNGMGWVNEGATMYFTDSWDKKIECYDYDVATGEMSNAKDFSVDLPAEFGWPDGLCIDTSGGIWSARWAAGKVIRLSPKGEVDVVIDFPKAWNMTSCVFGGAGLDELYVTSANTEIEGGGQPDKPDGGSLFVVRNLGFQGIERFRYSR